MPKLTVMLSIPEAEILHAASVDGLNGYAFTYDPNDTVAILTKIPHSDAKERLMNRMVSVAAQVGLPNVIFHAAPAAPVHQEPTPQPQHVDSHVIDDVADHAQTPSVSSAP